MGTRADFYVGRGIDAEWIGSIAFDGYPSGLPKPLRTSPTADVFRAQASAFFAERDDATLPEKGWPWPWTDSQTTDYAYAFDGSNVWVSCFGSQWRDARDSIDELEDDEPHDPSVVFPDMSGVRDVTFGRRSSLIVIGPEGVLHE